MSAGFGLDEFGTDPWGSVSPFGVDSASSLGLQSVRATFTDSLDVVASATTTASNYTISGLTVISVILDPSDPDQKSVILTTSGQTYQSYTVTVNTVIADAFGDTLDPQSNTTNFTGFSTQAGYFATAQSATRVQLVFITDMENNSDFIDPTNYTVLDLNGNMISVLEVTANGSGGNFPRCTLTLGSPLSLGIGYYVTISSSIVGNSGLEIQPKTSAVFSWTQKPLSLSLPVSAFTGEVRGGLYGDPLGLVFFSPSLTDTPAPNSSIQVDEVDVCTRAYDSYEFPPVPENLPTLYTYGVGWVSTSVLGPPGSVLFSQPLGSRAIATLVQTTPPGPTTVIILEI